MCSKVTYRTLNFWLYYLVIHHLLQYVFQIDAIFLHSYISQGSVATCIKRGGIFKQEFVANLLLSRCEKNLKIG